ncbi:MAG TPA: tRNA lysidine(34) synthetase TilS [Candidatus Limnocylindrales bacterium]|nr:tRNA lysidine(34) synthetase TilS [Candidatus Limnocylindrales bacterium]
MTALAARVAREIHRHLTLWSGERVLVAVSGGPDSLALLSLLRELIPDFGLALSVAHFDHRWRQDSADDARFVSEVSERWGFACITGSLGIEGDRPVKVSEDAARRARYAFLRQAARDTDSSVIALGHTQDDQVETLLLHLLRGSGAQGLAAMRPRSGDLARPLLSIPRADIEAYLRDQHLQPRRDPSNDDPAYTRNRLRLRVLPVLEAFDPAARRALARAADILAEEDRFLEEETARLDPALLREREAFAALPIALQRRLVRRLNPGLSYSEVEAFRATGAATIRDPGGSADALGRGLQIRRCTCDPSTFRARDPIGHLDAETLALPLRISQRQPGDRVQPLGQSQPKRLQDLLVDARIPRLLRDALPIVRDRFGIVWIPGVTVAEPHRVTNRTRHQLHLEIVPSHDRESVVTTS